MKDLASAYMARRYAKGGTAKACAHGGPVYCAEGCYAEGGNPKLEASKMAEGGEVEEEFDPMGLDGDQDLEMAEDLPEEEMKESPKTAKVLSKLLGKITKSSRK